MSELTANAPSRASVKGSAKPVKPLERVQRIVPGVLAWFIALLLFFPIFWMTIT